MAFVDIAGPAAAAAVPAKEMKKGKSM